MIDQHCINLVVELDYAIFVSNKEICDVYSLTKQTCNFPKSTIVTSSPLELIHCDIWEKFSIPSYFGCHYFSNHY